MTVAERVATYIQAKDSNRPHLMSAAFAPHARLDIVVNSGTISFPPRTTGLDAIANVLVSRFGQVHENVYTFCLCPPPSLDQSTFSCTWLVGMSEKDGGAVRIGCGRYDWAFSSEGARLVDHLRVTIERMETLPSSELPTVINWLVRLPYPWCATDAALETMPKLKQLQDIARHLSQVQREDA